LFQDSNKDWHDEEEEEDEIEQSASSLSGAASLWISKMKGCSSMVKCCESNVVMKPLSFAAFLSHVVKKSLT
jgi:hypothetical protein